MAKKIDWLLLYHALVLLSIFSPCCLVQRCVALVIPRVHLRPLDQQRQSDVVVPVSARQMQRRVLDASLRVEIRPLIDELSYHMVYVHREVGGWRGIEKKKIQRCGRGRRRGEGKSKLFSLERLVLQLLSVRT